MSYYPNPYFRYCPPCDVLWQGHTDSTCWNCNQPGTQCNDDFVYTATSMGQTQDMTSDL